MTNEIKYIVTCRDAHGIEWIPEQNLADAGYENLVIEGILDEDFGTDLDKVFAVDFKAGLVDVTRIFAAKVLKIAREKYDFEENIPDFVLDFVEANSNFLRAAA